MRSSLRERQVVLFSIAVPVVLYPLLLWGMFTMMSLARERGAEIRPAVARITADDSAPIPAELSDLETVDWLESPLDSQTAAKEIREGILDAALLVRPGPSFEILYSGTGDAGPLAESRLRSRIASIRWDDMRRGALLRGVSPAEWIYFRLKTVDISSRREQGSFMLGLMLPVFFTVMVAVGSFYPAVDSTAGNRERHTWETLMSCGVGRTRILAAKYLSVATFGTAAGILNVGSMTLSLSTVLAPIAGDAQLPSFSLSLASIPLVLLSSLLLAGMVSAGMMILASFARNFREGQALVQPFYIMTILPALLLQLPGLRMEPLTALVPFLNTALLVRSSVQGTAQPVPVLITAAVSAASIVLMLRLASRISAQEGAAAGDIRLRAPALLQAFVDKHSGKGGANGRQHH